MKHKINISLIGLLLTFSHAEITDPKEQHQRGYDYYFGKNGVSIDYEKARQWYEKSAHQNYQYAQSSLSSLYLSGLLGDVDYEQGLYWLNQACDGGYETSCRELKRVTKKFEQHKNRTNLEAIAESNDPKALFELGSLYYTSGNGVSKDINQAVLYWEKSAKLDFPQAQFALGQHYQYNDQFTEAKYWFEQAAQHEHSDAQFFLGLQNERGQPSPQDMPQAIVWYEKAIEQNNDKALYNLGILYANGSVNQTKDWQSAFELWQQAAQHGSYLAKQRLAQLYHTGQLATVPQDYLQAAILYEQGYAQSNGSGSPKHIKLLAKTAKNFPELLQKAENGDPIAQYLVGAEYMTGLGIDRNIPLALEWYTKAAEQNHLDAQLSLGSRYEMSGDSQQAVFWYEKAAQQNSNDARYELGNLYRSERHQPYFYDIEKAKFWYQEAIKNGHDGAIYRLKSLDQKR